MTSLIDELQRDAADTAAPVSALLRKALIVATKLEVSDIPAWIDKELSGYADSDALPSCRVVHGTVRAQSLRGWLPVQFPTGELQDTITKKHIYDSIA